MADIVVDEVLDLGLVRNTFEEVDENTIDLSSLLVMILNEQMMEH